MTSAKTTSKLGEKLYFVFFICIVTISILETTTFKFVDLQAYRLISYILLMLSCLGLLFKAVLLDTDRDVKAKALKAFGCILLAAQATLLTGNMDLFLMYMVCVGAHGIDAKKILKVYLAESLSFVIMTTILALTGIIPNLKYFEHGVYRSSLGNTYCTDYAARIFFLVLVFLCIYNNCLKIRHIIGLLIISVAVFIKTFARLDFICILLALILFSFDIILEKKGSEKFKRKWDSFCSKIGLISMPVAATVMFFFSWLYSEDNRFLSFVNTVLNNRLKNGHNGFSEFGVPIFGQAVRYIGLGGSNGHVDGYNFVDCSYLHMLFREGILATVILIIAYVFLARKFRINRRIMYIVALVALNCMIAHHIIEIGNNPLLILLFAEGARLMRPETSKQPF